MGALGQHEPKMGAADREVKEGAAPADVARRASVLQGGVSDRDAGREALALPAPIVRYRLPALPAIPSTLVEKSAGHQAQPSAERRVKQHTSPVGSK